MKIVYMGIVRNDVDPVLTLVGEFELKDYSRFTRGTISDVLKFATKLSVEKTKPGQRKNIEEQGWHLHTFSRSEGAGAVIVADQEYPGMVAQSILSRLLDEFITKNPKSSWPSQGADYQMKFPELKGYLEQYQNPENADSLMKIQKELDETKVVLHNTINAVLDRGEKLEDLEQKSKDLQGKSYFQYQQAKKLNSCCVLM